MTNNEQICRRAFGLVEGRADGAGLTICLAGGGDRFLLPGISAGGLEMSMLKAGIYRGEQRRPAVDLRVFVEERADKIVGHIERITGVAFLSTQIDPSEFVGHFEVDSWASAETACARVLTDKLPGVELSTSSVSYRHNKFAEKVFAARPEQGRPRGLLALVFGAGKNQQVGQFVGDVVARAFDFNPEGRKAKKLSLWFTINGECMQTVYVDIEPRGKSFAVSASDRARWPWKEKAIQATIASEFAVSAKIAGYIEKAHGSSLRSMEVYFNWSEALP